MAQAGLETPRISGDLEVTIFIFMYKGCNISCLTGYVFEIE
jgi:hypothetical protein